jgi:cytochrome c
MIACEVKCHVNACRVTQSLEFVCLCATFPRLAFLSLLRIHCNGIVTVAIDFEAGAPKC